MFLLLIVGGVFGVLGLVLLLSGLVLVRDDQVGVLTRKMFGKKMQEGQIIACNGEIGIQAKTLMPGLYWRFPLIWKREKVSITDIGPDNVGVVESIAGEQLPSGQLLGHAVACNSFQDAKVFLDNKGCKGPQVAILPPGTYRINTKVFNVERAKATEVPKQKLGVVVALDGIPLPPRFIIAPQPKTNTDTEHPEARPHKSFQDGQAFLDSNGHRGPQLDTLQPGNYYLNPLLFRVELYDVAEVPPGYVAVIRSNVGDELDTNQDRPTTNDALVPSHNDEEQSEEEGKDTETAKMQLAQLAKEAIHAEIERLLTTERNRRGIWRHPIAPGEYNLNPIAYTPYLVPTSAITIDWAASSELRTASIVQNSPEVPSMRSPRREREEVASQKATEFFRFSQLRVTSKDAFQLDVDVRMVIRIKPENAAFVIARFGSVPNLIEQVVHPLIDSSFRNNAGQKKAMDFVSKRSELQDEALIKAKKEFEHYLVDAQNILISYIAVDKALLDTQTKREIAEQQQAQYKQEAAAEYERIQVEERRARASKQPDVVAAELSIAIAENEAKARIAKAMGTRDATMEEARGEAFKTREIGNATAEAYKVQAKALGKEATAVIKVMEQVGTNKVKITPEVLVSSRDGEASLGSLLAGFVATNLKPKAEGDKLENKNDNAEADSNTRS